MSNRRIAIKCMSKKNKTFSYTEDVAWIKTIYFKRIENAFSKKMHRNRK